MKWFRRKKKSSTKDVGLYPPQAFNGTPQQMMRPPTVDLSSRLSSVILQRIFTFVCPHAIDESYESCEGSATEDACMLCDLRDLAHCAQVSRRWRTIAAQILYHSIRIDAVHYCEREEILAEKRKRRSFLSRNAEPEDTAQARLRLLCRTLWEDPTGFAMLLLFFKVPYMTRETCKPDLARIAAVAPNLRYIDLPEGFYTDDPSCNTLKQEVQGRCPDIRKMSYSHGAEKSLEQLTSGMLWRNLEVLELSHLNMDPTIIREALGALPHLQALKVKNMEMFTDDIFVQNDYLPPLPSFVELVFEDTPNITSDGIVSYLSQPHAHHTLKTLSFTSTGVHPSTLYQILAAAPYLTSLSIVETVSTVFPPKAATTLLSSNSLKSLHYEIISSTSGHAYTNPVVGYYAYLASSITANGLPNLQDLYVRDPDFPEALLDLAPPLPAFASDPDNFRPPSQNSLSAPTYNGARRGSGGTINTNRFSSNNPFAQQNLYPQSPNARHSSLSPQQGSSPQSFSSNNRNPQARPTIGKELNIYTKSLSEADWSFTHLLPPTGPGRRGSMTQLRPLSSYGLSDTMAKSWSANGRNDVRKSVIVGNGFGGLLAVPADDDGGAHARPSSSAGEKGKRKSQRYDMWR
ncbi:hypothetical protein F5884DRAFT_800937 [Xylogone sp. PMI_703]|nr:hypothetical protein F5884DRAFT_800937 [Xylogone sp. PMI_703]